MIQCKKINGTEIFVNAELIEFVESTPDTIITTTTGEKVFVLESVEEVVNEIVDYKKRIFEGAVIKLSR